jgi:hypothetical protein
MFTRQLLTVTLLAFATGFSTAGAAADFPEPYDSQKTDGNPLLPAAEVISKFQLPPGFQATVFAAEPEVRNSIAMTFDPHERL